jgi:gliding motility-associated-like protein
MEVTISCSIFVPTAFSPNGDLNNDTLRIYGACLSKVHLEIYDRWGLKVFETDDPLEGWDGTYNGKELESAVFTYFLTGLLFNNSPVERQGNVTLVK